MVMVYLLNENSDSLLIHDYEPSSSIKAVGSIKQAVNSIDSFTMTLYPGNPGYDAVVPMKSRILVLSDRGRQIFAGRVLRPTGSMDSAGIVKRTFICEGELGYLCDTVQGYSTANTAEFFFRSVLAVHNDQAGSGKQISLGTVNIEKGNHRHTWSYVTSFKAITDYVNEYGGEFRLRYDDNGSRYLDYTDTSFTSASDTPIELMINLISVSYTVDPTKIASGVFAAGARLNDDGTSAERLELDNVIWSNSLVERYGKVVACETWDDITTSSNLYARASAWLQEQPSEVSQFTVTAAQLYEISYSFDDFEVGTTYPISNPLIGLDDTVRCVSRTIDINDPTKTTLTFGDRYTTIAQAIAETSDRSQQISRINSSVAAMDASINNLKESASGMSDQIAALESEVDDLYDMVTYNRAVYQTEEHRIGRWIDNSYVYEKTLVIDPLADGTARSVSCPHGIGLLREIIESRGQLIGRNFFRPLECMPIDPGGASAAAAEATSYSISDTAVTVTNGTADQSGKKAYITLRYTLWSEPPATIYGWHVDPSVSDPAQAVTYLADAIGKSPAAMGASAFSYGGWEDAFFMPKPCMLKYDGTVDYYLDPADYSRKLDGTASDIANINYQGNAMMEWPLIWYKFEAGNSEGEGYFYCADRQVDESYKCWCNTSADNEITPHFYTAIYNGTIIGGRMRSLSGLTLGNNGGTAKSGNEEVTAALANNPDQSVLPEWYTAVWSDWQLITALLILMGKSLNLSAVFGKGFAISDTRQISNYITGSAGNAAGLFHGDTSGSTTPVKVFGMENWWGCIWHRRAGFSTSIIYCYKLTYGTADGSSSVGYQGSFVTGYIPIVKDGEPMAYPASAGHIEKMYFGAHGFVPLQTGNSASNTYYNGIFGGSNNCYTATGGASGEGSMCIAINNAFTAAYVHIGSSLSCKPLGGA